LSGRTDTAVRAALARRTSPLALVSSASASARTLATARRTACAQQTAAGAQPGRNRVDKVWGAIECRNHGKLSTSGSQRARRFPCLDPEGLRPDKRLTEHAFSGLSSDSSGLNCDSSSSYFLKI
jgi:hypothetical protein